MQRDHVRRRSRWYGTAFSPLSLFFGGANGAWYDPSDFSTMFQDAAGTTPVTAVGQPVGRILDKSGRGNHAYNPSGNSANFPVLQQAGGLYYLAFNGVNQWLRSIGSIDFTYGDKVFVSAGVRKLSDAATAIAFELSASLAANIGAFAVAAPLNNSGGTFGFASKGTTFSAWSISGASFSAPSTVVLSGIGDISGSIQTLQLNASQVQNIALSQGTGNYGNYPFYIGARGGSSFFFNGRLYGLVVAGKSASASEIANTETWLNQKTGAY